MANKVKIKTHSGAAKRFIRAGSKKSPRLKRRSAYRSHILSKHSRKLKRQRRSPHAVSAQDKKVVTQMLGG